MSKFTCPYCYGEHDPKDCTVICHSDSCKYGISKDPGDVVPRKFVDKCLNKCDGARKWVYCPVVKSGEIPMDFLEVKGLPIALVGAKASGKSNYIGVLVDEIKHKFVRSFNASLGTASVQETLRLYNEEYHKPIYDDHRAILGTDLAGGSKPPLIFPLRFLSKSGGVRETAILTFYDSAGEAFYSASDMEVYNGYIPNAGGIIILLDPLQVPSIRKKLQAKGMTLPPMQASDVTEILSRVIETIRNVKNIRKSIKIPVALAFTKIDLLEEYGLLPDDSCLRDESAHTSIGAFSLAEFRNTELEMHTLIENWADAEIVQLLKNFDNYAIFGLSSFGCSTTGPKGLTIPEDKFCPRRVLDPLIWLLAQNKIIKTVK